MDPVRVIIFVAVFLLLIILGRKLSGSGDSNGLPQNFEGAPPLAEEPRSAVLVEEDETEGSPQSRIVGADLPFPIRIPDIEQNADGRYNRPEFLNYYFENTD